MGGLAGHMNHVYDNINLSFSGLLDIFTQAASGNLNPTEKVDGQNLYFTYDVSANVVKFARTPTEASDGGITKEDLNSKFEVKKNKSTNPESYQSVVDAFYFGMTAIEMGINSVPDDILFALFERSKAADTEDDTPYDVSSVFINCEIMYSEKRNMIMYDGDFIVFHKFHLLNENLESMSKKELIELDSTLRQKFNKLVSEIEKNEQLVAERQWRVVGPQVRQLNNLEDTSFLQDSREKIEKIITRYGMTLDNSFADYVAAGVKEKISSMPFSVNVPDDVLLLLQRAVLNPVDFANNPGELGGSSLTAGSRKGSNRKKEINGYLGGSSNDAALLSNFLAKGKSFSLMSKILEPFAQITPGLTAPLMQGVQSAFMKDSDKGTRIFKRTVELAIQHLKHLFENADPNDKTINSLKQRYEKQMKRLKSVDNISTAMEGVVFEYPPMSNQFYKFTGGFAAANQILGYLGWDVKEELTAKATAEINSQASNISESKIRSIIRKTLLRHISAFSRL